MSSADLSTNYVPLQEHSNALHTNMNNNLMSRNQPNKNFYSPQNTFYGIPNQPPSGIEILSDNSLLHMGLKAFGKSVKEIPSNSIDKIPIGVRNAASAIKYYFDVDQTYVVNKLCLLLFPFRSRKWSLAFSDAKPVPPRADANAPDYYIPVMSALTYVLIAGVALGMQNRFTPEQLGAHASSAFIWNIIEVCALYFTFYIFDVRSKLHTLDLTAYCGYKYVGMIATLVLYLMTHSFVIYAIGLFYVSVSLSYFLLNTLRLQILPDVGGSQPYDPKGTTRRIYLLLSIVLAQPFFIWYQTWHLVV